MLKRLVLPATAVEWVTTQVFPRVFKFFSVWLILFPKIFNYFQTRKVKTALNEMLRHKILLCLYSTDGRKKLRAFLNSAPDGERLVSDSGRLTPKQKAEWTDRQSGRCKGRRSGVQPEGIYTLMNHGNWNNHHQNDHNPVMRRHMTRNPPRTAYKLTTLSQSPNPFNTDWFSGHKRKKARLVKMCGDRRPEKAAVLMKLLLYKSHRNLSVLFVTSALFPCV